MRTVSALTKFAVLMVVAPAALQPLSAVQTKSLAGTWKVSWTEGNHSPQEVPPLYILPMKDPGRYIDVPVPMELHRVLQAKGLIEDPNIGINSFKARWVAEQIWSYRTEFAPPREALLAKAVWLVLDGLDLDAVVSLNGQVVGRHANAYIPLRIDLTGKLREGPNELIVVVESGLYDVADRSYGDYSRMMDAVLNKRQWLRKPQYQFIWDWNPRLINVGITGDVRLEWTDAARLDQVVVFAQPSSDFSSADMTVRASVDGVRDGPPAVLRARVKETGQEVKMSIALGGGLQPQDLHIRIDRPRLWWPRGHGKQELYTVEVDLLADGTVIDSTVKRTGIRSVVIDRSPHPVEGEYFIITINGRRIFCKGGNWVPADMIYSSVDHERTRRLVDLAVDANFNLLRIWGGGLYAGHDLLDFCDEKGLLVWHDFLFACSKYPADDGDWLANVRRETTWAVREFARHPSLAVWCGNNEIEWGVWAWGYESFGKRHPDYALYHFVLPVIVKTEDPTKPYWPSSPFSPNHEFPNSPIVGDQHPWDVTLGQYGEDFRAYRRFVDRFPNEGGVLGASSPATLRQFLPAGERRMRSFSWEHHDNGGNFWTELPGITYRTVKFWLGSDPAEMTFDDYVFASALLQAEGLEEYIANYRRRMFSSSSAIFWMYNDSWPVTHGWTIVDYYLRKKLAFHPVRRAFEPVTVVVADDGPMITVYGVNEGREEWKGALRYGLFATRGGRPLDETKDIALPADASTPLATIERSKWEALGATKHGAFAALYDSAGNLHAQHRLFLARFKDLDLAEPGVRVKRLKDSASYASDVFVWGVALDIDGESDVADNAFDIIPGLPYRVPLPAGRPAPLVLKTGNDVALRRGK